ncbi:MAG TPA: substrate-binding domain-containing protein, partial [Candidatus Nanopelagicales bacterium]|nr:substrate-binding domain-containing protein [Candidatus Nanopelagicales bacterium]
VYVTDAKAAGTTVRSVPIPAGQNQSTAYPIVAVAGSSNAALAADWISLVTGPTGQDVLKEHGFSGP